MKNYKLTTKGIVAAISFFVLFACCSNTCFAQSFSDGDCVYIYDVFYSGTGNNCDPTTAGSGCSTCDVNCIDVTIESCNGEYPVSFQISSGTGYCFSICSPTGDFGCHYSGTCDDQPKVITWKNTPYGMNNSDMGTFRICSGQANSAYAIALSYFDGTVCTVGCSTPAYVYN
jgi:hypothetical protein